MYFETLKLGFIRRNLCSAIGFSLIGSLFLLGGVANAQTFDEQPQNYERNQREFERGVKLLEGGFFIGASEVFSELYQSTQSLRVKLEWARALYLSGQKNAAKKIFQEVLDANPPFMVRERIGFYIEDIDNANGKIEISGGFVSDTNPKFVTNNRVVNIFGGQYVYTPGFDTSPKQGFGYSLITAKTLDESNKLTAGFNVNGTKFESHIYDKTNLEQFIAYKISDSPRLQIKASIEEYFFGGQHLYTYPSASIRHIYEGSSGGYWWVEGRTGVMNYQKYTYLNGPMNSMTLGIGQEILPQWTLGLELGVDRAKAAEDPYSFRTQTLGVVSNYFVPEYSLKTQIKFVLANRSYDEMDPVFGEVRSDQRRGIYLNLVKTDWKIWGVAPTVDLGYEINTSNIDIFTYKRYITALNFKKVY